jgi:hypothetical protein
MEGTADLEAIEEQLKSIHQYIVDFEDVEFVQAELDAIPDRIRGLACSAKAKRDALAQWRKQGLLQHAETAFKQLIREIFTSCMSAPPQVSHQPARLAAVHATGTLALLLTLAVGMLAVHKISTTGRCIAMHLQSLTID